MEPFVTAFEGSHRIAAGPLPAVTRQIADILAAGFPVLVFDDATGRRIDLDPRAPLAPKPEPVQASSRGRPKLGVVGREITLLPRHWDWLAGQPGGASVALRKLVEDAMRSPAAAVRAAQEAAYRFMTAVAGDLPGYEEANRALFAGDGTRFDQHTRDWPPDVRDYARRLAAGALA